MNAREEHLDVLRSARIYSLGAATQPVEIWIVCHGYGQLAARFIREFEPLAAPGRLIVAPEALHRFYRDPPPAPAAERRVGATWMTREDREADIRDNVRYLDRVVAYVSAGWTGARIRALGFSQGAATVFRWAALGATRVHELILWAGEVPPDVDMQPAAAKLRQTRVLWVGGSRDEFLAEPAARRQHELLEAAGLTYEARRFEGGHRLDAALLAAIAARPLD